MEDETSRPIKGIVMQSGKSPSSGYLGTVEGESQPGEGTPELDRRESVVWTRARMFQGEIQHAQRAVRAVEW